MANSQYCSSDAVLDADEREGYTSIVKAKLKDYYEVSYKSASSIITKLTF
jgi:hypothetical protein